jgi:hypothetical protein
MKRRIWSCILVLCMVLTLLPFGAAAADVIASGTCSNEEYGNLTWKLDRSGTLTISGTGYMESYNGYHGPANPPWADYRDQIVNLVVEDGAVNIGDIAFRNCRNLKTVTLADSVESLDQQAFMDCTALETIKMDGVFEFSANTFPGCTSLKRMHFGPVMRSGCIRYSFNECPNLEAITVDAANPHLRAVDGVVFDTDNGANELLYCPCAKAGAFTIPEGTTSVDPVAFVACTALTELTIPASLTALPDRFTIGSAGKAIHVAAGNPEYISVDGVLYNKDQSVLICCPAAKTGKLTIPASVKEIRNLGDCIDEYVVAEGNPAYASKDGALFSKDMTKLYRCAAAFAGVYQVPASVKELDSNAFARCTKLTGVTLPSAVTVLPYYAFQGCTALKEITIPNQITKIEGFAFDGCENLASITIPASVNEIGWYAFTHCPALRDIRFAGTRAQWNQALGDAKDSSWVTNQIQKAVHCSDDAAPAPAFSDVKADAFYAESVDWAVNHNPQITNGVGDGKFAPGETCTRGQVVTFLWRAMGCPEPKSTSNPFTDVKEGSFYYKAVLWAVENDVTKGMSTTTFAPGEGCTRAHVVTFLWRAHAKPAAGQNNPFSDVPAGQYYSDAVLWAVSKDITKGITATTFVPGSFCTRGQIVTFLYRDMK